MKWFVVVTRPRMEYRTNQELKVCGVETLFLHFQEEQRNRKVFLSYFPRYLFACPSFDQVSLLTSPGDWMPLCWTDSNGYPQPFPIPDLEIERLKKLGDYTGQIHGRFDTRGKPIGLRPRDKGKVESGPLQGFLATIEEVLADGKRLRLTLERQLLCGARTVVTDANVFTRG